MVVSDKGLEVLTCGCGAFPPVCASCAHSCQWMHGGCQRCGNKMLVARGFHICSMSLGARISRGFGYVISCILGAGISRGFGL